MSETIRTFLAVELTPEVRQHLADVQELLMRAGARVKWTPPEHIHLTLVFLGNVPADAIPELEDAVRDACRDFSTIKLTVGGTGCFPPKGKPRVLWSGIEEPTGELLGLQKALVEATKPFAEKVDDRPYKPHLTLGRVRKGRVPFELSDMVDELAEEGGPTFVAREVVIFRSDLSSVGARYTPMAKIPL